MHRRPPLLDFRALALVSLLPFAAIACGGDDDKGGGAAAGGGPGGPPGGMPPAQVLVVTLKAEPVTLERELPGRTSPLLVAEVRPQVSGLVKRRLFTEGGLVSQGQPLYELDDSIYRAEYENARAALAKAEAGREAARLTARRATELHTIDAVSEQEKENAVAAQRAAEADVAAARAMVERQRVNLRYARITSPISGRIGMSTVTAGALVTANQDAPLATVQKLDPIYVDVNQSSSEWLRLRRDLAAGKVTPGDAGTPVAIVLEDGTRYPHPGKLQAADVTVDEGTGSFALRVLVPNPEGMLRPGMYVTAVLAEAEATRGGAGAAAGSHPRSQGQRQRHGRRRRRQGGACARSRCRARSATAGWWRRGSQAGDRVIVEGLQKVQPGMPVQAVEVGTAPPAAAPGGAAPGNAPAAAPADGE